MPKSCDITGITKGRDQFIPFCHCPTCTWGVVGRAMDETLRSPVAMDDTPGSPVGIRI